MYAQLLYCIKIILPWWYTHIFSSDEYSWYRFANVVVIWIFNHSNPQFELIYNAIVYLITLHSRFIMGGPVSWSIRFITACIMYAFMFHDNIWITTISSVLIVPVPLTLSDHSYDKTPLIVTPVVLIWNCYYMITQCINSRSPTNNIHKHPRAASVTKVIRRLAVITAFIEFIGFHDNQFLAHVPAIYSSFYLFIYCFIVSFHTVPFHNGSLNHRSTSTMLILFFFYKFMIRRLVKENKFSDYYKQIVSQSECPVLLI